MRYIRLDDLSAVELNSWEVWHGPVCNSVRVKKAHLKRPQHPAPTTDAKYHSVSAAWAVRIVEASSLDARVARIAYLLARDGKECFYCGRENETVRFEVEHIIPTAHGGPDHASNLCLTCPPCNRAMGALSGVEKVKLAIKIRTGSMKGAAK